jgi:L-seryl-tRNA(Ser) seleniumtransferase
MDPARLGLTGEPHVRESLARGAELVCFSGDKLLGGPQSGVLVGKSEFIERMRSNPLCRALRVDKVTLAGLEATLRLYREPERALREIPALIMLATPSEQLEPRARSLAAELRSLALDAQAAPGSSVVGGGTCPQVEIASWTVRIRADQTPDDVARRLRESKQPVVARIEDDEVVLDLRTVLPDDLPVLTGTLADALTVPPS